MNVNDQQADNSIVNVKFLMKFYLLKFHFILVDVQSDIKCRRCSNQIQTVNS